MAQNTTGRWRPPQQVVMRWRSLIIDRSINQEPGQNWRQYRPKARPAPAPYPIQQTPPIKRGQELGDLNMKHCRVSQRHAVVEA